jgi:hypothetical protein
MVGQTIRSSPRKARSGVQLAAALIAATLALGALKDVLIYAPNGADADLDSPSAAVVQKVI